jgi:hypothetical protein
MEAEFRMAKYHAKIEKGVVKIKDDEAMLKLVNLGKVQADTFVLIVAEKKKLRAKDLPFFPNPKASELALDQQTAIMLKKLEVELKLEKEKNDLLELTLKKKEQMIEMLKEQLDSLPLQTI